jgi:predicted MFS family arabinose efflux permease
MDATVSSPNEAHHAGEDRAFGEEGCGVPALVVALFSVACGLAVAGAYYAQPLLDTLADQFSVPRSVIGSVITFTQIGYGVGLVLLVPLGDVVNRRRLIVGQLLLSALASILVAAAPTAVVLMIGVADIGLLAVVTQTIVAYSAYLATPEQRGRTVGIVTVGVILGIILARTLSGTLADVFGWRSVYIVAAVALGLISGLLYMTLPPVEPRRPRVSYAHLIRSTFTLFIEEPLLRVRAFIGLLVFGVVNMLWTPMVLPLGASPFDLTHTQVGMFGFAGAMGALGAANAGRWADSGYAQTVTGAGLLIMLVSWLPIAMLYQSIWLMVFGVLAIDFALQAVHVSNQALIFAVRPEARSRLVAGYMLHYSVGCAAGSLGSTLLYAHFGWTGVCICAAATSAFALAFWFGTMHVGQSSVTSQKPFSRK